MAGAVGGVARAANRGLAVIPRVPTEAALVKAAEDHPNITLLAGRTCIDLITGKHELRYSGSGRVWGAYALNSADQEEQLTRICRPQSGGGAA